MLTLTCPNPTDPNVRLESDENIVILLNPDMDSFRNHIFSNARAYIDKIDKVWDLSLTNLQSRIFSLRKRTLTGDKRKIVDLSLFSTCEFSF